jgi:hypothetical protein
MKLNAFLKPLKQGILLSYTKTFAFPEIDNTMLSAFERQLIMRALSSFSFLSFSFSLLLLFLHSRVERETER